MTTAYVPKHVTTTYKLVALVEGEENFRTLNSEMTSYCDAALVAARVSELPGVVCTIITKADDVTDCIYMNGVLVATFSGVTPNGLAMLASDEA
jgi:hypothetical protein